MKARYLAPAVVSIVLVLGPACGKTSGGLCEVDEHCPGGSLCVSFDVGDERRCHETCETEEDCPPEHICSSPDPTYERVCHPPFPVCDPEATDADCQCGTLGGALRVQGVDGSCMVEAQNLTVCAWHRDNCWDGGCTTDYFRYSYSDDLGYLVRVSGPSAMPDGWERDGSDVEGAGSPTPTSCPAAASEF